MWFQVRVVSGGAAVDVTVAQFFVVQPRLRHGGQQVLPQRVIVRGADLVSGQPHAVGRDGRRWRQQGDGTPRRPVRRDGRVGARDAGRRRRGLGRALLPLLLLRQRRRGRRLARPLANRVENSPVKQRHDNARDVERGHGRIDEEIRVVECTQSWRLSAALGVVHS